MISLLLATMLAFAQVPSTATAPGGLTAGLSVRDAGGTVVGRITEVVTDRAGRPTQVLIRTGGRARLGASLKVLPLSGVRRDAEGVTLLLSRAELESLPSVSR